MNKIRVELAQRSVGSRVWLDDVEITHNVRGITISAAVHTSSEVVLVLSVPLVEIEGEAGIVREECPTVDPFEG